MSHHIEDINEAESLHKLLKEFFPHCKPTHSTTLLCAWAEAALRHQDTELMEHVNAARRKIKGRDTYVHTVLGMCYNQLTRLRK